MCFNSQYEQLFTLTLAYKLVLEHDVSVLTYSVKVYENLTVKLHCFGLG